jgi:hypothetical protein
MGICGRKEKIAEKEKTFSFYVVDLKMKSLFFKNDLNFRAASKSVPGTGTRAGGPGPLALARGRFSFNPPC